MGKTIVITGAGIGLGRALARRFAADGETLVLLGRTLSKVQALAEELGEPHFAVECDVGSPDSVRKAFAEIAERHPRIDVLINNAAVYEPFMVADARDDQILAAINSNFAGTIFCCRSAIPMMQNGAVILNVTSESISFEFPMLSLYASTKAGVERFSKTLSIELEPVGIRVSNVRAGPMYEIGKDMNVGWDSAAAEKFHELCIASGIDLRQRPLSNVTSVTGVFRALIDLPPDVRVTHASIEARRP